MTPVVVLVGAPGAGKTTVAALVARSLGVEALDTDEMVEQASGSTVSQIFLDEGEARFRELEHDAVTTALDTHDGVLALGGGAVLDVRTRVRLRAAPTVWLKVTLGPALSRVGMNQARPLLLGNVRGQLVKLLDERAPLYAEVASATVVTDERSADEVAADVLDLIGGRTDG